MKIAIRGGHCPKVPGASKFIDELTEDRKVKDSVIYYLKQLGCDVLDVTPPDAIGTVSGELSYGVNKANNWGADLFVSIHFNKAYDVYEGFLGSEVCVYTPFDTAQRVVNGLAMLGFKNRGQKVRTNLYEVKRTNMKSMIIEVCFVESIADVGLYKKLGHDLIGKTIAECIVDRKTTSTTPVKKEEVIKPVQVPVSNTNDWVSRLQAECNKQGFSNQTVDGIGGSNTLKGCPTLKQGARGNITKLLQEKLVSLGYNTNGVDGIFGSGTKKAVMSFQKANGLVADGIVGQNTWRKLLNI